MKWLLVLTVIGLAAQAGRFTHLRSKAWTNTTAQSAPVGRAIPYTVTLRHTIHGPDGKATPVGEITQAVRSDGSTLWRWAGRGSQRSLNFSSGLQVETNDLDNTKSSTTTRNQSPSLQRNPNSKCLNSIAGKPVTSPPETFLGEETIAGYRTVKLVRGTSTIWHALDYGCAMVKARWVFDTGDIDEKELVALVGGEPDATLFDVPAHYREVPPSERIMGPKRDRQPCNQHGLQVLQKLDEDYKRNAAKPQ
ncbi:MAG: hypothetical protein WAM70_10460 [Pyrinomonadaceae bacterium]